MTALTCTVTTAPRVFRSVPTRGASGGRNTPISLVTCTKLVVYRSPYKATQIVLSDASRSDCMHPCAQIWQSDGASGKKVSFFSMEANTSISMSRQLILKWADFGSLTPAKASKDKNSAIGSLFCPIRLMCQKLPVFKLILNVTLPYFFRE